MHIESRILWNGGTVSFYSHSDVLRVGEDPYQIVRDAGIRLRFSCTSYIYSARAPDRRVPSTNLVIKI